MSNYEEKVKLCEKAKYAVFPEEICGAQDVFSQAWNHQQKKIDALEKELQAEREKSKQQFDIGYKHGVREGRGDFESNLAKRKEKGE